MNTVTVMIRSRLDGKYPYLPAVVLFGVKSDSGLDEKREWRTVTGSQEVDLVYIKSQTIEGQTIWRGDAVAILSRAGSNWPAAAQFVQGDICL